MVCPFCKQLSASIVAIVSIVNSVNPINLLGEENMLRNKTKSILCRLSYGAYV